MGPFPEPASDAAMRQPQSVFQNSSVALCAELPPSPLSPTYGVRCEAVASKASTQSNFVPDRASTDDDSASVRSEFPKVREQIDSFKRHGRSQISTLEDDLRALLQQQEEVEALAA